MTGGTRPPFFAPIANVGSSKRVSIHSEPGTKGE